MMYWASCPSDGAFVFDENTGEPLDPDSYLAKYPDWRDVTQWPTTARQTDTLRRSVTQQQDPLAKSGMDRLPRSAAGLLSVHVCHALWQRVLRGAVYTPR